MADFVSNYTGPEIDDAVDKASKIPQPTISDSNKILAVNSTGNAFTYMTLSNVYEGNLIFIVNDNGTLIIQSNE